MVLLFAVWLLALKTGSSTWCGGWWLQPRVCFCLYWACDVCAVPYCWGCLSLLPAIREFDFRLSVFLFMVEILVWLRMRWIWVWTCASWLTYRRLLIYVYRLRLASGCWWQRLFACLIMEGFSMHGWWNWTFCIEVCFRDVTSWDARRIRAFGLRSWNVSIVEHCHAELDCS